MSNFSQDVCSTRHPAGSEFTPFKHVGFAPYTADTWTDHWFPVRHTRGLTNVSPRGALNVRAEDGWLKIDWMSLENQTDTLKVLSSGSSLLKRKTDLKPMELLRDSVKWSGSIDEVIVRLGDDVLTSDPGKPLNRPLKSPENFDWKSEYGLLVRGTDLSKQKNYSEAEEYLMKAIEMNPDLVPALTQMAQIRYRQGLYESARQFAGSALAVNTYDPEANYFWGLSSGKLGNDADARDGFSVATLSPGISPCCMAQTFISGHEDEETGRRRRTLSTNVQRATLLMNLHGMSSQSYRGTLGTVKLHSKFWISRLNWIRLIIWHGLKNI